MLLPCAEVGAQGYGGVAVFRVKMVLPEVWFFQPAPGRVTEQPLGLAADESKTQAVQIGLPYDAIHRIDQVLVFADRTLERDDRHFLFRDVMENSAAGGELAGVETDTGVSFDV